MSDVQSLFGPMLIGTYLNAILYGVMIIQVLVYFQTCQGFGDKVIRYLILYLVLCETVNTALDIILIYEPLVLRFGTMEAVTKAPLMLDADAVVTVLISTPVQLFLCWRIKSLSGSKLLTWVIIFFSLSSLVLPTLAGGVAVTICVSLLPEYAQFHIFEGAVITWLISSAVADVIITASLVWSLHTRKTGFSQTDSLVNRIITLAIQTGALTTTFALLDLLMFAAVKTSTLQFVWDFPLGKLYTNSLLSTLNARQKWNASFDKPQPFSTNVLFAHSHENMRGSTLPPTTTAMSGQTQGSSHSHELSIFAKEERNGIGSDLEEARLPHSAILRGDSVQTQSGGMGHVA